MKGGDPVDWWPYIVGSVLVPVLVQMLRSWKVADTYKTAAALGVSVLVTIAGMAIAGEIESWTSFMQSWAVVFAGATVFYRTVLKPGLEKGMSKIIAPPLVLLVAVCLIGCGSLPGGAQSPGTAGAPAVATGVQAAQTIGRDQGQAQTPQTVTTGTATQNWWFASQVDSAIQAAILAMAEAKDWTAEQTVNALKATNGAPENVNITTQSNTVQSGAGDQAGSSGGTGGSNLAPPNPKAP